MEQRNAWAAVIGAGDYIGGAIAKKFAAEGFTVFAGRRQGDKLAPLVAEVEANGGRIFARSLDARKEDDLTGASWVPAKCRPARRWNHRNREQRILRHFCTQPRPVAFSGSTAARESRPTPIPPLLQKVVKHARLCGG